MKVANFSSEQISWKQAGIGLFLTALVITIGALAALYFKDHSVSDFMNVTKGLFLESLQGQGRYERILIAALFVGLGNALLIPINILLLLTALFLPSWDAFFANMTGSLIAAFAGYLYGHLIGASFFRRHFGKKFDIVAKEIKKDGFKTVVLLCFAPIAPNTLTNVLAGLSRIPLWKLAAGTIVGFLPGVTILTLLGHQMRSLLNDPGYKGAVWLVGLLGILLLSFYIGKRAKRRIEAEAA